MSETFALAALEFLIQYGGSLSVHNLWIYMCNKFYSFLDFKNGIGKNIYSFNKFLLANHTLFHVVDTFVYVSDLCNFKCDVTQPSFDLTNRNISYLSRKSSFEDEAAAVKYFQDQLYRKSEQWVPIKSLAGHLSQASSNIRACVGPQSEFYTFLIHHPLVFEIQGDLVGLRDGVKTLCKNNNRSNFKKKGRPLSLDISTDLNQKYTTTHSVSNDASIINLSNSSKTLPITKFADNKLILAFDDFKAVIWILHLLHKRSDVDTSLTFVLSKILHAPITIKNCVGRTQIELFEFLKKYNVIFDVDENSKLLVVKPCTNIQVNIITRCSSDFTSDELKNQRGCIFCVNRLWGIIDLGFHEHVFFDRSLFKNVADLTRHFTIKEIVYFDAVLTPKDSRSKWRATCVWKESDELITQLIHTNPTSEDHDSGLENSEESPARDQHKIDYSNSLKDHFKDFSTEFDLATSVFAGICLTDAWELDLESQTTKNVKSQGHKSCPNPFDELNSIHMFENQYLSIGHQSPSSDPGSCISDLNTLSEIPSISNMQMMGDIDNIDQLQTLMATMKSMHRPGCRCMCFDDLNQLKQLLSLVKQMRLSSHDGDDYPRSTFGCQGDSEFVQFVAKQTK